MDKEQCNCQIESQLISPNTYMKIINHKLRKKILHTLHKQTLNQPTTKKQIAKQLNIKYEKINYQLNNHLNEFWTTKKTKKIRGTIQQYIAPKTPNSIYINIGQEKIIFIIDPLANLYGKIQTVGTRCDQCTKKQQKKCLKQIKNQKCFQQNKKHKTKWKKLLQTNNRKNHTAIDYMIACEITKIVDQDNCILQLTNNNCPFLKKIKN
ncbi:Transcriptional regulator containing HTH domain ArsR family [Methanonatronarchaeum thermophilum]|uniref:Transcriptional regulator containing HTH domain ArsR family n=1 Tax=Methanonatronarchaeum thermophilum TaxID=1927129 RepID=A0A1Y3GJD0_9EURY|nr:hypothetical protein [Methanonatronarchaeum thermophilum]OUJ19496.1 Transcriptional regulator containing HTH domain ArsR family [Methanonatronarchaeum thermophilum]